MTDRQRRALGVLILVAIALGITLGVAARGALS
jgi:hypothetical protein